MKILGQITLRGILFTKTTPDSKGITRYIVNILHMLTEEERDKYKKVKWENPQEARNILDEAIKRGKSIKGIKTYRKKRCYDLLIFSAPNGPEEMAKRIIDTREIACFKRKHPHWCCMHHDKESQYTRAAELVARSEGAECYLTEDMTGCYVDMDAFNGKEWRELHQKIDECTAALNMLTEFEAKAASHRNRR